MLLLVPVYLKGVIQTWFPNKTRPLVIVFHWSLFTVPLFTLSLLQGLNITVCIHTSICAHRYIHIHTLYSCGNHRYFFQMCVLMDHVHTYISAVHTCICVHIHVFM